MSIETLRQIQKGKQILLNKAFIALLNHPNVVELYLKHGQGSFDSFTYDMHLLFNQTESEIFSRQIISQPIDKERHSPEMYSKIIKENQEIAMSMQQVNYEPPLNRDGKVRHLIIMWHLYEDGIRWPSTVEDVCLDLSFTKLLCSAHRDIAVNIFRGERESKRSFGIKKGKQKIIKKDAELVEEIFLELKIPPGTSFHGVAVLIRETDKTVLHPDTIKTRMDDNPKIKRFFRPRGRGRIYENITSSDKDKKT